MSVHHGSGQRRYLPQHGITTLLVFITLLSTIPPRNASAASDASAEAAARAAFAQRVAAMQVGSNEPPFPPAPPAVRVDVEQTERTAFTHTTRNADGTYTTVFSQRPLYWQDPTTQEWKEFSNQLQTTQDADFAYENNANGFQARFGRPNAVGGGRSLMHFAADGTAVGVVAVGANPNNVSVQDAQLTYTNAFPNVDIRYTLDNERVKEDLVLHSAPTTPATQSYRFDLLLNGLSATKQADNSIRFTNAQDEIVFEMPAPFMFDSSTAAPEQRFSTAIDVTLQAQGPNRARLTITPSLTWLQAAERVYPVMLDPTFYYAQPFADTPNSQSVMINQASASTNYSSSSSAQVGKNSSGQRQDMLIKFPELDAFNRDTTPIQALLKFDPSSGTSGLPIQVHRNNADWSTSSVTWNNAPGSTNFTSYTTNLNANSVDVTRLVLGWARKDYNSHGMRLISTGSNSQSITIPTGTASGAPTLEVKYIKGTRFGLDQRWTYTNQDHGDGTTSYVNVANGNHVLQHQGGSIPALGFNVDLTHTYNSQDSFGLNKTNPDKGAYYGESWSFNQDWRLHEADNSAVVFKDGTGVVRVYVKDSDSNNTRSYTKPLGDDFTLTKDTKSTPTDASKVYTLTADTGGVKYFFDADGKQTRRQDRNSNYLNYTYDTTGRITKITDRASRETKFEYNGTGGRLSKITDMASRVSSYGYDTYGNLTSVKHGVGSTDETTTTFFYRVIDMLTGVRNPRDHLTLIDYRNDYNWETSSSVDGWEVASGPATIAQSTEQKYTDSGSLKVNLTSLSSSTSAVIEETFTDRREFSTVPMEFVVFVYVPSGAPTIVASATVEQPDCSTGSQTAQGNLTAGQWNALHMEQVLADASCPVRRFGLSFRTSSGTYTGAVYVDHLFFKGNTTGQSDATSASTTDRRIVKYSYDWEAKSTEVRRMDQGGTLRDWTYVYSDSGQVTKVTDPLGNVNESAFDESLRITSQKLAGSSGNSYTISYYPNSNQLQTFKNEQDETSRRGANTSNGDTRYVIDPLNEKRRGDSQSYQATIFNRDSNGNVTSIETNTYASGTNLESSTFPSSSSQLRSASYQYGTGGTITKVTDARGNAINLTYQTNTGYLTQIDAPAGNGESTRRVTTITPNSDGTTQKVVDPKGQTTTYEYDGLGRLRKINYGVVSGTATFSVSYTLDKNGNMTAMSDKSGSSSWSYDTNNQVTSESRTQNSTTKTTSYAYYDNTLLKTITTFANQTATLTYDNALRLTGQTDPKDGGKKISFGYDGRNRRTAITYPSGVAQKLTFDKAGRLDLLTLEKNDGTKLQSFDYAYGFDSSGTRGSDYAKGFVTNVTELDGSKVTYTYDDLERLSGATRTGTNAFTHSYAYDKNNNRTTITKDGTATTATYDAANQMTALGSTSYTYDRNGNLTAYGSNTLTYDQADDWVSGTVNGSSVAFGYDGWGRRTNRTVSSTRTDFWYDQTGLTLETGGASATYLRDPQGALLSVDNGTLYNYGRDRLSSTTALVTTGQALNTSYRYDPWGESIGGTGSAYNPFQFTGVYRDSATSLYRMTQRYYQPTSGRFTQFDPLPESVMLPNRYEYANCNPSNFVDPTGLVSGGAYECAKGFLIGEITGMLTGAATGATTYFLTVGATFTLGYAVMVGAALFGVGLAIAGCATGVINHYL